MSKLSICLSGMMFLSSHDFRIWFVRLTFWPFLPLCSTQIHRFSKALTAPSVYLCAPWGGTGDYSYCSPFLANKSLMWARAWTTYSCRTGPRYLRGHGYHTFPPWPQWLQALLLHRLDASLSASGSSAVAPLLCPSRHILSRVCVCLIKSSM